MKRRGLVDGQGYGSRTVPRHEQLAEQIQAEDRLRMLEPTSLPKVLRGRAPRRQANTALLTNIALDAFKARLWAEGYDISDEDAARVFRGEV